MLRDDSEPLVAKLERFWLRDPRENVALWSTSRSRHRRAAFRRRSSGRHYLLRRSGHRRVKISLSNWTAYTDSDTARNFSSTSHVLFLRCRNVLVVGEHEGNEEREKGQVAKPRLIAYRPLVSKVHRGKAQFPTRPVCSSLTGISRTRIAAPSKDLHLIIVRPGVRTEERPRVSDKSSTPGPARLVLRARDEATLMTRRRFSFFPQKRTDALCFSFFLLFSFLSDVNFT